MNRIITVPMILACSSGGLAHVNPVGGLVAGAVESVLLDEALQQVNRMAVASLPVRLNPARNLRKHMARQVPHLYPGQN
jgi:hypothetical protein